MAGPEWVDKSVLEFNSSDILRTNGPTLYNQGLTILLCVLFYELMCIIPFSLIHFGLFFDFKVLLYSTALYRFLLVGHCDSLSIGSSNADWC